jgi:hypothetical protein
MFIQSFLKGSDILRFKKIVASFLTLSLFFAVCGCAENVSVIESTPQTLSPTTTVTYETDFGTTTASSIISEQSELNTVQSEIVFSEYIFSLSIEINDPAKFNLEEIILKYPLLQKLSIHYASAFPAELHNIDIISSLKNLKSLSLENIIPIDSNNKSSLDCLKQLNDLSTLHFFNVYMENWEFLSEITYLRDLTISGYGTPTNNSTELKPFDYNELNKCNNLQNLSINLSDNPFDFKYISNLNLLQSVYFGDISDTGANSKLFNFKVLGDLPNLNSVSFYKVSFEKSSDINYLADCEKLESFSSDLFLISDLEWASDLEFLRDIYICVSPELKDLSPLSGKDSLRNLCFIETGINDIEFLGDMKNLENIDINYNEFITDEQLIILRQKIPNCNIN